MSRISKTSTTASSKNEKFLNYNKKVCLEVDDVRQRHDKYNEINVNNTYEVHHTCNTDTF